MTMLQKASLNVVRYFMVRLTADGKAATALTITTFDLQYTRELAASATKIDAIVGTGGATTHVDNKVFELDSTSSPGLYLVCFPDAAFATGADQVTLALKYDSTVYTEAQNIQLVDFDPFDTVRMGLTALPAAAADAAGGLAISDAGGLDLDTILDVAISTRLAPTTAARTLDVNAAGEAGLDFDNTSGTLAAAQFASGFITAAKFASNAIDAAAISPDFTTEIVAGMNDLSTADIDARLVAIGLDHLLGASVVGADVTDNSIFARLVSASAIADWDDFVNTTDALQAIRDKESDIETDTQDLQTQIGTAGAGLGDLGGMSTAMKAEVNVEVDGALDTVIPELGVATPSATPTLRTAVMLPYMGIRNKRVVDATSDEFYNDAGTIIFSAVLSDDTVEMISAELI